MDSLETLKIRLRAVQNIGQITKAMEVVAATKMRRAQEIALASRPYALQALDILARMSERTPLETIYTLVRPIEHTLLIIVASDKGLAGAFNTQVFRATDAFFASDPHIQDRASSVSAIAVGKKAAAYVAKRQIEVVKTFTGFGDYAKPEEIEPLANLVLEGYREKRWDRVIAISTHFYTTLRQETLLRQILPTDAEKIRETVREILPEHGRYATEESNQNRTMPHPSVHEYIFEPSPQEALSAILPHLITMQIYHLVLEANASEHSARRVAMKNASDNADEISGKLILAYNKARQAAITKEIIEITSTQAALV